MGKRKNKIEIRGSLITLAALVIVIAGAMASASMLTTFLLALFITIISIQPVLWLSKKGLPHVLAVVIMLTVIIGLFVGVGALVGNSINSFANDAPVYAGKLRTIGHDFIDILKQRGLNIEEPALEKNLDPARVLNYTASILTELGSIMSNALIIFFIVLFMLLESSSVTLKAEVIAKSYNRDLNVVSAIVKSVRSYLGLKTIISFITGLFIWLWLWAFGIEYAIVWGLLAFLLNYIPNFGSIIAGVPAILFALVQSGLGGAGWTLLGYAIINMVVGNVVEPRLMGKEMGLSTLVVFLSLIFWGFVLGTVGMFLAVPLTMTFKIILDQNPKTKWLAIMLGSEELARAIDEGEISADESANESGP